MSMYAEESRIKTSRQTIHNHAQEWTLRLQKDKIIEWGCIIQKMVRNVELIGFHLQNMLSLTYFCRKTKQT